MSHSRHGRSISGGGAPVKDPGVDPGGRVAGPSWRAPAIAGLAGTAVVSLFLAVQSTVIAGLPVAPSAIAHRLVRVTSGSVNTFFIDRLGPWAPLGGMEGDGREGGIMLTTRSRTSRGSGARSCG